MEIPVRQAKRIKVEHSYASSADVLEFPRSIKEDISDEENDVSATIKIEIDDTIKTEPSDPVEEAQCTFEYFDVPIENEPKIAIDQLPMDNDCIKSESEIQTINVNTILSVKDPLELVKHDFEVVDKIELIPKPGNEKRSRKKSKNESTPETIESKSFLRLQKERDNLQKQIQKLRADLKTTKAREKALQTELGARRMAEISLEEKKNDLENKLQESLKQEKSHSKVVLELNKKIMQLEKENLSHVEFSKVVKREFFTNLEKVKAQLRRKELEHKLSDTKYKELTGLIAPLKAKLEAQTSELSQKSEALAAAEKAFEACRKSAQSSATRVVELTKEVTVFKGAYEELQKSLLNEKKMSRLFVKERDQQQQALSTKLLDSQKELMKQKQIMGTLTSALTQKVTECKSQKDMIRVMKLSCQKQNQEINAKMEELEKRERELKNKQCEYCGF